MAHKSYDIAIKVGEYERNGEKKNRYKNIGAMFEGEKGPYILLDATILSMPVFALANKERRDSVIVSMFEPKDAGENGRGKPASTGGPTEEPDSEIPF